MLTESRQLTASRTSWASFALGLTLGCTFITGCDRSAAPDATTASASQPPRIESAVVGVVLRAEPNPVIIGNPDGTTMITWNTGSTAVGDVYVSAAGKEQLFASGPKGAEEASWIKPGSTEFRLYNQADHKLLAQVTVTMATPSASNPSATPITSANP